MSVQITPMSPRVSSVGAADDPFKKYWMAILAGFVLTGLWLCLPIMETPVGSAHVDTAKPAVDPNAAQNLDLVENAGTAPGFNVSMDAIKRKAKGDEPIESMLYQPPADATAGAAASGAPLGSASGSASAAASLAQQLKDVGDKKTENGWGEKAQRGFTAPRLAGGLSGAGSASGGSSASASASAGMGAFGSSQSQIGFGSTRGLKDDGSADKHVGGVAALRKVEAMTRQAAANRSNDGAVASNSRVFDGAKAQGIGGPAGPSGSATYDALDAAPANLKLNDPKLDKKELKEPTPSTTPDMSSDDSKKQLAMMAATMLIGGMLPGTAGTMVMMMGQFMIQQQEARAAEQRSMDQQKKLAQKNSNG